MGKILITGANGYIGRHLIKKLLRQESEIVALVRDVGKMPAYLLGNENLKVLEGDLTDKQFLARAVEKADAVFHLAAALRMFEKDGELYKTNILGLKNILQACQKLNRPIKFIFASSIDAEKRLNTDYGKSKLEGEKIIQDFCQKNLQIKYTIVRIGNVYGGREEGMVEGVRQLISKNDWRASILYHHLADKPLYLIKIENLINQLIRLADLGPRKKVLTLVDEQITIKELTARLKKEKLIAAYPQTLLLDSLILKIWQLLGRALGRADLLIYLSLGK